MVINVIFNIEEEVQQMTKNSLEIGKILVSDQDAANRLKRTLIQSADSACVSESNNVSLFLTLLSEI